LQGTTVFISIIAIKGHIIPMPKRCCLVFGYTHMAPYIAGILKGNRVKGALAMFWLSTFVFKYCL